MPEILLMDFRFRTAFVCAMGFLAGILFSGCISYQFVRELRGAEVTPPDQRLTPGTTTLGEVLSIYGAPDKIEALGIRDLLIYQRSSSSNSGVTVGIPLSDLSFISPEISARGKLGRYDTLALFFTSDGVLQEMVYTEGSGCPYLKTLFEEKKALQDHSLGPPGNQAR